MPQFLCLVFLHFSNFSVWNSSGSIAGMNLYVHA